MMTNIEMSEVREVVAKALPIALSKSEEELRADVGAFALRSQSFHTEPSRKELAVAGDEFLEGNIGLQKIVCDAANKKLIEDTLSTANVAALVGLLLPLFSATGGVPAVAISVSVLVLRIGLNTHCRGYKSTDTKKRWRHSWCSGC
jgi:hypothetical protein